MLTAMDARINALAASSSSTPPSAGRLRSDRVAGMDKDTIKELQAEGKCFRCKKAGHMKNECPDNPKSKNA